MVLMQCKDVLFLMAVNWCKCPKFRCHIVCYIQYTYGKDEFDSRQPQGYEILTSTLAPDPNLNLLRKVTSHPESYEGSTKMEVGITC